MRERAVRCCYYDMLGVQSIKRQQSMQRKVQGPQTALHTVCIILYILDFRRHGKKKCGRIDAVRDYLWISASWERKGEKKSYWDLYLISLLFYLRLFSYSLSFFMRYRQLYTCVLSRADGSCALFIYTCLCIKVVQLYEFYLWRW